MKTSVVEVGGMVSALSARGVEKRLTRLPGVQRVEVNYISGSATVTYDEIVTDLKAIKAAVHECGYHCAGEYTTHHFKRPSCFCGEQAAASG